MLDYKTGPRPQLSVRDHALQRRPTFNNRGLFKRISSNFAVVSTHSPCRRQRPQPRDISLWTLQGIMRLEHHISPQSSIHLILRLGPKPSSEMATTMQGQDRASNFEAWHVPDSYSQLHRKEISNDDIATSPRNRIELPSILNPKCPPPSMPILPMSTSSWQPATGCRLPPIRSNPQLETGRLPSLIYSPLAESDGKISTKERQTATCQYGPRSCDNTPASSPQATYNEALSIKNQGFWGHHQLGASMITPPPSPTYPKMRENLSVVPHRAKRARPQNQSAPLSSRIRRPSQRRGGRPRAPNSNKPYTMEQVMWIRYMKEDCGFQYAHDVAEFNRLWPEDARLTCQCFSSRLYRDNLVPQLDENGKIVLSEKGTIVLNPAKIRDRNSEEGKRLGVPFTFVESYPEKALLYPWVRYEHKMQALEILQGNDPTDPEGKKAFWRDIFRQAEEIQNASDNRR